MMAALVVDCHFKECAVSPHWTKRATKKQVLRWKRRISEQKRAANEFARRWRGIAYAARFGMGDPTP